MGYETIIYEKNEGIATITLNRPEKLNSLNWVMNKELQQAWQDVNQDTDVVVAILTGMGDRALCTGIDVSVPAGGQRGATQEQTSSGHIALYFTAMQNHVWKPVITACNGMVVGGGLHFLADSDIIITADHATFFDTHVKVGMVSANEPVGLIRRMPFEAVMRMSLMGGQERISAQRAYELGLVSDVVPKERLMERAREIAKALMQNSPTAMMRSKQAIWGSLNFGLDEGVEYSWRVLGAYGGHADQHEGPKAFMEKRAPTWGPATTIEDVK